MSEPIWGIPPDIVVGPSFGILSAAPENWGMKACFVDRLRAAGGDGEGEVIAILDTGLDPDHPELAGRVKANQSFVSGESAYDGNGHGTHCAGTAAGSSAPVGVSGKPKILGGKCLSNRGSGSNTGIRQAYQWAVANGATVISMSIGGPGFIEGMEDLIRDADTKGIVTVLAAGNERQEGGVVTFPSTALVIAAVDSAGRYATFSNPANSVTILSTAAPGVNIVSARPGGGYQQMSGTSMATPFAAGVVASYQSARTKLGLPRFRNADFKKLFASRNVDAGTPGLDRDYGPGLIDCGLLTMSLTKSPVVQ